MMIVKKLKIFHLLTLFKLKNKVIATSHAQISAKDGIFSLVAYVIISSSSSEFLSELSTVA